jgi:hypothetical protein
MTGVRTLRFALLTAGLAGLAPAASAAPSPASAPAVQAVVDCRKLADTTARLACYDAAVDALTRAEQNGDVVSLDRAQRQQVRRQAFGFSLPSLTLFDAGEKADTVNRLDETLASAGQGADGRWIFRMQDGQVWRQVDDNDIVPHPHPGSKIVIRRAALGSYMLSVDGQAGVRAHRDD